MRQQNQDSQPDLFQEQSSTPYQEQLRSQSRVAESVSSRTTCTELEFPSQLTLHLHNGNAQTTYARESQHRRQNRPSLHWDELPRALAEGTVLRTVSMAAGRRGARAGMQIVEARSRCADLDIRTWDQQAMNDAVLAGTAVLLSASPQVTPAAGTHGMWWVGAHGFDIIGGEEQLARTLLEIAQQWHPEARVAIADSCVAARAATWSSSHATLIPPGHCASYLAPAPIGLLPMPADMRSSMDALGMHTIGAFAALDASDVEDRWGHEGLAAWRLAHGDDPRRPGRVRTEAVRNATVELPGSVDSAAAILFVVRAQLQRLLSECVRDGRAAASVSITLALDAGRYYPISSTDTHADDSTDTAHSIGTTFSDTSGPAATAHTSGIADHYRRDLLSIPHRTITREVRPARPLARFDPLFDQCRMLLKRWSIPAPVIAVSIGIPATAPLSADQGDLLIPSWRDAAMNAEAAFARLRAVLDPDQHGDVVVRPQAHDTHRPEESGKWIRADAMEMAASPPASQPDPANAMTHAQAHVQPVLRLLDKPEPVRVVAPHGAPGIAWWRERRVTFATAHGPERLSGDWWRGDSFARDYWRCHSNEYGELLLYRDGVQWYVHGWYD